VEQTRTKLTLRIITRITTIMKYQTTTIETRIMKVTLGNTNAINIMRTPPMRPIIITKRHNLIKNMMKELIQKAIDTMKPLVAIMTTTILRTKSIRHTKTMIIMRRKNQYNNKYQKNQEDNYNNYDNNYNYNNYNNDNYTANNYNNYNNYENYKNKNNYQENNYNNNYNYKSQRQDYNNKNYYQNDYQNNSKYVSKYKQKRRAYNTFEVPVDVSSNIVVNNNPIKESHENEEIFIEKTPVQEHNNNNQHKQLTISHNNHTHQEEKPKISQVSQPSTFNVKEEESNENLLKHDEVGIEVDELKKYFEKLRTSVTCNDEKKNEEGGSSTNYVSLLNKLKTDLMNNQYYNSNLNLQKKYENVSNSSNTQKQKPTNPPVNNTSNTLHLNSQFFEINNSKTQTNGSKSQFLEFTRNDPNVPIYKLSFSINPKEEKNNFVIESSSHLMNSKAPQNKSPEKQNNLQQQQNDYLKEQFNQYNNTNNKFKNPQNTNYMPNMMFGTPPSYFYNQDVNTKSPQESAYVDPNMAFQNLYMPMGYFPYQYERNMFSNMPSNMDPMMMNMYTNYFMNFQQQQPSFFQNMSSPDTNMNPYQYSNNVNYKK